MRKHRSGLLVPDELAPRRGSVSAYRWGKMDETQRACALADGWLPPIAGGSARTFVAYNGAMPTTAALVHVATGTAIKTLQQLATPAAGTWGGGRVIEWGISFDATASTPIECELIETDVAATITAYAAADIMKMNSPQGDATLLARGSTTQSGFTASVEGATTATRLGDYEHVAQSYIKQFPLGREFEMQASKFYRVRVTATSGVNAISYIVWEE